MLPPTLSNLLPPTCFFSFIKCTRSQFPDSRSLLIDLQTWSKMHHASPSFMHLALLTDIETKINLTSGQQAVSTTSGGRDWVLLTGFLYPSFNAKQRLNADLLCWLGLPTISRLLSSPDPQRLSYLRSVPVCSISGSKVSILIPSTREKASEYQQYRRFQVQSLKKKRAAKVQVCLQKIVDIVGIYRNLLI